MSSSDLVVARHSWCGRRLGGKQYDVCKGTWCGYFNFDEAGNGHCLLGGARPRPKPEDADTDRSDRDE